MTALKTAVKKGVGLLALVPPLSVWTRRGLRDSVNVVYTHYVGTPAPYYADFYAGSTIERFDRDLAVLKRHFEFVPLGELIRPGASRREAAQPLLALTFDDGFDAVRNGVLEVLDRHAIRATSFVLTGMIGNVNLMWRNKLAAIRALREERVYLTHYNRLMAKIGRPGIARGAEVLPDSASWPMESKEELVDALWEASDMPPLDEFLDQHRPYFTWDGLKRWRDAGHDVGLHTATHPYCAQLGRAQIRAEIDEPAALLRATLGLRFLPFSYPFGVRLPEAAERRLYEDRVFDCAFGIDGFAPRGTPPFRLERACIEADLAFGVFGTALLATLKPSDGL